MILEKANKYLIGFIDELYKETNSTNKSKKINSSNKKKLARSYLQTSDESSNSINIFANIELSVLRKIVNR
ncbi:hypothetical protein RhiirC2_799115 [Rhizophagus irregularis]|uniref:Uncharacterized protein n=1 Tax=Rhizophagus irregularis TaxID=588596 RepID=A0A2N1M5G0_9GLOM|nr:hypothetical protein RhiirC2_799115 [Rhizophagus irregularis]